MSYDKAEMIKRHRRGKKLSGFVVVIIGLILLLKNAGVMIPDWLISWPMILVVVGLFTGIKNNFQNQMWWILTAIGIVFLIDRFVYDFSISQYFWPIFIIGIGLAMIFSRRHKRWDGSYWEEKKFEHGFTHIDSDDYLDTVTVFGSVKKNIVSKDFKGGEMVNVFGGSELNLTQAEIKGNVSLELVNIMGGTKLIVPSNWEIRSEVVSIFGGIEDKRPHRDLVAGGENVLLLRGTSLFGGIDIKSF